MWYSHTTHMSNVQWMPYSFAQLYLFKCVMVVQYHVWSNPKRFWAFWLFLEVIFVLKNLEKSKNVSPCIFVTHLQVILSSETSCENTEVLKF